MGCMRLVRREHVDLLVAMHRVPQAKTRAQLQVSRFEHTFKQQDGATPTQGAYALGLAQVQQGKSVRTAHGVKHPLDAVTVRIGLDHSPDVGIPCRRTHTRQVMANGLRINKGLYGTGHENKTCDRSNDASSVPPKDKALRDLPSLLQQMLYTGARHLNGANFFAAQQHVYRWKSSTP